MEKVLEGLEEGPKAKNISIHLKQHKKKKKIDKKTPGHTRILVLKNHFHPVYWYE